MGQDTFQQQFVVALCSLLGVLQVSCTVSTGGQFHGHALKSYRFWCSSDLHGASQGTICKILTMLRSILALCLIMQCCLTKRAVVGNSLCVLQMKMHITFPLVLVDSGIRPYGKREMLPNVGNSLSWDRARYLSLLRLVSLEASCSTTLMDPSCACHTVSACFLSFS